MLFSIITPIFNRSEYLYRIAESIQNQQNFDLNMVEWIIVDDGSTDDIVSIVENIQRQFHYQIIFLQKQNGGKHTAVNLGIGIAQGYKTFILDSDDYLGNYALSTMERSIKDTVNALDIFLDRTSSIGKFYQYRYDLNGFLKLQTEVIFCVRTSVFKDYLFPEFSGEKFVTESIVWNQLINNYYAYAHGRIVVEKEYLTDGLTSNYQALLNNSPQGVLELVRINCKLGAYKLHVLKQSAFHYAAIINYKYNRQLVEELGYFKVLPTILCTYYVFLKRKILCRN